MDFVLKFQTKINILNLTIIGFKNNEEEKKNNVFVLYLRHRSRSQMHRATATVCEFFPTWVNSRARSFGRRSNNIYR